MITNSGEFPIIEGERQHSTVNLFFLSGTCSWTHTCLVPNDYHTEESTGELNSFIIKRNSIAEARILSSHVADFLMDTDADTDTDTVIWVETVEWCLISRVPMCGTV